MIINACMMTSASKLGKIITKFPLAWYLTFNTGDFLF